MQTEWTDGHIRIRPLREEDAAAYYEAALESIDTVAPWLSWLHEGYSQREAEDWIRGCTADWAETVAYPFAILDADDRFLLGSCGLNHLNHTHYFANLWYWIRRSQAGYGYASAAVLLLARFGFLELHLQRIEIVVDVANTASMRVAEKVGASPEGLLRNRLLHNGRLTDAVMHSLLPEDLGLPSRRTKPR
jgi:RimJ/RimL family protein N-acetyltransferase